MAVERSEGRAAVGTTIEDVAGEPEPLGNPDHSISGLMVSRRNLLQAGALGGTALAFSGLALPTRWPAAPTSMTQPGTAADPVLAADAPTLSASVLRREDMLALRLDFYNLVRSGMNLVRQVATSPAYVVATLGYGGDHAPQNVAEEAFPEGGAVDEPGDLSAALAGPTRLAFVVPASITSIPYSLPTILGLLPGLGLNVAPAALPPGATPASPPVLADPGPLETRIEAPWKLVLSPHAGATWSHASGPVTRNGRTELWHTRLSDADPVGRALRAVWTDGYDPLDRPNPLDPGPFVTSLKPVDRWDIVRLTSDFSVPDWTPIPVQADRLMLTALGAWLDAEGTWPFEAPTDLLEWRHLATMGRDQFVKVVRAGFLFPFGNLAVQVEITERKISPVPSGPVAGAPAAYLRKRTFIVVLQPVIAYGADDNEPHDGRLRPFRRVELKTLVSPDLDPASTLPLVLDAYFPAAGGDAVRFAVLATDREGRSSEFTTPLVFVPEQTAADDSETVADAYTASNADLRRSDLAGAKVGFTPTARAGDEPDARPGDSATEVKTLTFGAGAPEGLFDIHAGDLPVYPTWTEAAVRLDAVEQVRGRGFQDGVVILPHTIYRDQGFGPQNPAELFAKIKDPVELQFSDGGGDRGGGVITPDMTLINLSRKLGPQPGRASQPDAVPLEFNPSDLLRDVKLLGSIDLADVLETVGFDEVAKLPEMKTRTVHPNDDPSRPPIATETRYTYRPQLKEHKDGIFDPGTDGSLTLDITYRTPLVPPGEPTYEIVGDLRRFKIMMLAKKPDEARFVRITFSRLTFTSRSGAKPDIHPEISKVEFDGPLKFVDSIKDYLKTPGTGPFIDVQPNGVTAGFNLQIPNIAAGAMTLMNIVFSAALRIPFNGSPARARFALSSREHPFLCTWIGLGGGGFFAIELGLDGIEMFELDTVGGASVALDAVLVTVEVHAYFGVHFGIGTNIDGDDIIEQVSYIRWGGHCNVWGFWGFTIDLYLGLEYDGVANELWGQAKLTVELTYMWLTKDVELSVERRIAGPSNAEGIAASAAAGATTALYRPGDATGAVALASATTSPSTATTAAASSPPLGYDKLVNQNEWNAYAAAFAADA